MRCSLNAFGAFVPPRSPCLIVPTPSRHPPTDNREWCCPACVTGGADVSLNGQADPTLPPLGWRMQRGLFLPPGWEALLASEEHKAMARRALGDDGAFWG